MTPRINTADYVCHGWRLGSNFETIQIIPASGCWATYKDGTKFPVVAWAMQARLLSDDEKKDFDDDETAPGFVSRVVGLVMMDKHPALVDADDYAISRNDDFAGYEWSDE